MTDKALLQAFEYCLTSAAQAKANECTTRAQKVVQAVHDELIAALAREVSMGSNRTAVKAPRTMGVDLEAPGLYPQAASTAPRFASVDFQRGRGRGFGEDPWRDIKFDSESRLWSFVFDLKRVCDERLGLIESLHGECAHLLKTTDERLQLINELTKTTEERLMIIQQLDAEVKRLSQLVRNGQ
jgi:hypothetical protein